jgi:hypothetical protein
MLTDHKIGVAQAKRMFPVGSHFCRSLSTDSWAYERELQGCVCRVVVNGSSIKAKIVSSPGRGRMTTLKWSGVTTEFDGTSVYLLFREGPCKGELCGIMTPIPNYKGF